MADLIGRKWLSLASLVPGFAWPVPGFGWLSLASCPWLPVPGFPQSLASLIARAQAARQRWMKGIGYARKLTAAR